MNWIGRERVSLFFNLGALSSDVYNRDEDRGLMNSLLGLSIVLCDALTRSCMFFEIKER
jgi:hypothetical protein